MENLERFVDVRKIAREEDFAIDSRVRRRGNETVDRRVGSDCQTVDAVLNQVRFPAALLPPSFSRFIPPSCVSARIDP